MRDCRIIELENDSREASNYIKEHYNEMVACARKMVNENCAVDLVHDVYMSIIKDENNGKGYNMNYDGKFNRSCGVITVEQFVYGRMKGYSLNERYRNMNSMEIAASATCDTEDMNNVQLAYENATSYDAIELLDIEVSLREELEYLMTYSSKVNIKFLLKNIFKVSRLKFDISFMSDISELVKKNKEFAESLATVLKFAGQAPAKYESILSSL